MIDVREINSLKFNIGIRFKESKKIRFSVKKNLYTGIANYFFSFFQSFYRYPLGFRRIKKKENIVLFVYSSQNQLRALNPIFSLLKENSPSQMVSLEELPVSISYLYSLFYIPDFIRFYKSASREEKKIIGNELNAFLRSYGDYRMFKKLYEVIKPSIIVLANDHVSTMRAAIMAANDNSVISLYVQHAAVTDKFPKLITTYAFLDGMDAYEKYQQKGIESKNVFLIGGSRFDAIKQSTGAGNKIKCIGVALTLKDDKECWTHMIEILKMEFSDHFIVLRPHPGMALSEVEEYCNKNAINYSNPKIEDSFSFLSGLSFLVANETSIHLDATIMHIPTVLCSCMSKRDFSDHYGFVKSNIVEHVDSLEALANYIKDYNYSPSDEFVRKYNASYNTGIEGSVSKVICEFAICQINGEPFVNRNLVKEGSLYAIKQ